MSQVCRKDHLVVISIMSALVIGSPPISNRGFFDVTNVVYAQPAPGQTNSNTTSLVNMQDIPLEKVHVGDIDVALSVEE